MGVMSHFLPQATHGGENEGMKRKERRKKKKARPAVIEGDGVLVSSVCRLQFVRSLAMFSQVFGCQLHGIIAWLGVMTHFL